MRFLFVDRILALVPGERIFGLKQVTPDDTYLTRHVDGRVCFAPSLIGETLGQLAAWNVMHTLGFRLRPVAGMAAKAQVLRPAYVGETLMLESYIDKLDDTAVQYHSVATVHGEPVFVLEGALGPMLPMSQFISEQDVRQQFDEIYRPGDWPLPESEHYLPPLEDAPWMAAKVNMASAALRFDRVTQFEPKAGISAIKQVTRTAPYFADHFPHKPVLPMTLLLECILQLGVQFIENSGYETPYRISAMQRIKMNAFIQPGDVVSCDMRVKRCDADGLAMNVRCEVAGQRVCLLELLFAEANEYE